MTEVQAESRLVKLWWCQNSVFRWEKKFSATALSQHADLAHGLGDVVPGAPALEFGGIVVGASRLRFNSDNGSEFINWELLRWCGQEKLTFTRSRSGAGNKNDGAHVEQKNWHVVRHAVGYHR